MKKGHIFKSMPTAFSRLFSQLVCVVALSFSCSPMTHGQPAPRYWDDLVKLVRDRGTTNPFNGVLLVGNGERVIFLKASGFASFELRVPLKTAHKFRIASLSKQFAGLLAVLMAEKGIVDLDVPVENYHGTLKGTPAGAVTLREIFAHSSGLPNDRSYLWDHVSSEYRWDWRKNKVTDSFAPGAFIREIAKEQYLFEPRTGFSYSNEAYVLAGLTLAAASKESFESLLAKYILVPLGMNYTGIERIDSFIPNRTYNYEWTDGNPFPIARFRNLAAIGPAGGMYSTATDLHKWAKAIFHESSGTIPPAALRRFIPSDESYSFGLMRSRFKAHSTGNTVLSMGSKLASGADTEIIWHNGQIAGTFAFIGFLPGRKVHFVILSNVGFTFPQQQFVSGVIKALEGVRKQP